MIETTFRVGRRWKVTLRFPCTSGAVEADWHPEAPNRRLNKVELRDYRRGVTALGLEYRAQTGLLPVLIDSMFMRGVVTPREDNEATMAFIMAELGASGRERQ